MSEYLITLQRGRNQGLAGLLGVFWEHSWVTRIHCYDRISVTTVLLLVLPFEPEPLNSLVGGTLETFSDLPLILAPLHFFLYPVKFSQ